MTELYIDGTPAYLPQDLAVQVKRENPLFTKNGEYTYDITLPLSAPANAELYSHLNRLNSVTEVKTKRRAVLVAEAAADPEKQAPEFDLGLEHGIPVLKKEIPLKVHTYMHDMTQVVEIARDFDIEVTIDHAQGASDFYDTLSDPHVRGVIFGPTSEPLFPGEGGKLDYECCKGLDDEGVPVSVMTDGPVTTVDLLLFEMGECVRRGMDPVRALAMVTSNAARIVGVYDRVGSLTVGKDADILIWSKMPTLAADAVLEQVFIDGERVYQKEEGR